LCARLHLQFLRLQHIPLLPNPKTNKTKQVWEPVIPEWRRFGAFF
jgi:hypothetical protein